MTRDPVCGMRVDEKTAPATVTHEGTTYYFCSEECKKTFLANPKPYLNARVGVN